METVAIGIVSLCQTLVGTDARSVGVMALYAASVFLVVAGGLWVVMAICREA